MKTRKLFRRKITKEFLQKHFKKEEDHTTFDTYFIGVLNDDDSFYETDFYIEDREDRFSVCRGLHAPSYWVADVEYIYQLRRLLSIYNLKK